MTTNDVIEVRDIDTGQGSVRVTIERDLGDWSGDVNSDDLASWREGDWEYVTVTVNKLHYCTQCRAHHQGIEFESLGAVQLGTGHGWTVTVDDLFSDYPVPDMIIELMKGSGS